MSIRRDGVTPAASTGSLGKLFYDVLPALLLLELVHARGDKWYKTAPPHARAAWYNVERERRATVVDELAGRVEAFAAMAQQTGSISLGVEVEEEGPVHHCQATVEHIKAVLQLD